MGGGFIAIWIIFAVIAAYNGKKNGKYSSEKHASEPIQVMPKVSTKDTSSVTKGVLHITKESTSLSEMEDRKHDWLARQLAEERRVLLKGSFSDLGAAHQRECAAQKVKKLHFLEHDDSVDDGEINR